MAGEFGVKSASQVFPPPAPPESPDAVMAQVAQGGEPIGRVDTLQGGATVVRQGETLQLALEDPVFEADILQTGPRGEVTIVFTDGTTFSLSPDARMALESYLYAPEESANALTFDLLQGSFVFITGAVTSSGDFLVETPVAVIGIRGTSPAVKIGAELSGDFAILPDPDGQVGSYGLFDPETGELITLIDDPATLVTIAAPGAPPQERALAPDEITDFYLLRNRGLESFEEEQERQDQEKGPENPFDPNDENDRDPGARDTGGRQRGDASDGEGLENTLHLGDLLTDPGSAGSEGLASLLDGTDMEPASLRHPAGEAEAARSGGGDGALFLPYDAGYSPASVQYDVNEGDFAV